MASNNATAGDFRILVGDTVKEHFVYKGVEFGSSSKCILLSNVSGMETAPIRNNYGDWAGKDGGYMSSQLYGGRVLTISGFFWDDYATCIKSGFKKLTSIREQMVNGLVIRKKYPIFIKFMNKETYYTEGYMTDFKMDYDNYKVGEYQLTFYCPDYAMAKADVYGDPDSIYRYAIINKELYRGHLVPETLPVLFPKGQMATEIYYDGLIPCYPKIILRGPAINPTFINATTNMQFKLGSDRMPFLLLQNSELTIDLENRQVTVDGKSRSYFINDLSEWWCLNPGVNRIYYHTDSEADTESAQLIYRTLSQGC